MGTICEVELGQSENAPYIVQLFTGGFIVEVLSILLLDVAAIILNNRGPT